MIRIIKRGQKKMSSQHYIIRKRIISLITEVTLNAFEKSVKIANK